MISIVYENYVLVLKMPYDRDCIEEIKDTIPIGMRQWDSHLKVWFVGLPYLGTLVKILREYFGGSDIYLSRNIPNLASLRDIIEPRQGPYAELYLLPDAPKEVAHAAYKALAKLYHPDTGHGCTERMARINSAWERIKGN